MVLIVLLEIGKLFYHKLWLLLYHRRLPLFHPMSLHFLHYYSLSRYPLVMQVRGSVLSGKIRCETKFDTNRGGDKKLTKLAVYTIILLLHLVSVP
jgi:hypothetical protein